MKVDKKTGIIEQLTGEEALVIAQCYDHTHIGRINYNLAIRTLKQEEWLKYGTDKMQEKGA